MTDHHATGRPAPVAIDFAQAAQLFTEVATLASCTDDACRYIHDDMLSGGSLALEAVQLELDRLREVIRRIGWMADLGAAKLGARGGVRGDAEQWLLSPAYQSISRPHRTEQAQ